MGLLWGYHGTVIGHGTAMGLTWLHDTAIGLPWDAMGFSWDAMGFPYDCHGFHGAVLGLSWDCTFIPAS